MDKRLKHNVKLCLLIIKIPFKPTALSRAQVMAHICLCRNAISLVLRPVLIMESLPLKRAYHVCGSDLHEDPSSIAPLLLHAGDSATCQKNTPGKQPLLESVTREMNPRALVSDPSLLSSWACSPFSSLRPPTKACSLFFFLSTS